jgi:hypothetical protein
VSVDRHIDVGIDAAGDAVSPTGVCYRKITRRRIMEMLIEAPDRIGAQIECRHQ